MVQQWNLQSWAAKFQVHVYGPLTGNISQPKHKLNKWRWIYSLIRETTTFRKWPGNFNKLSNIVRILHALCCSFLVPVCYLSLSLSSRKLGFRPRDQAVINCRLLLFLFIGIFYLINSFLFWSIISFSFFW